MPERMIKCPECGGIGDVTLCSRVCPSFDETIGCPLCSGSGTIPDRRKPTASDRALRHLLNIVNAVTAPHRHGQPASKRRLDDLANAQLEYEEAERYG